MKIKCICKTCKKEFYIINSRYKKGEGKFCSKKCFGIAHRGDNNHLWKEKIKRICQTCGKEFYVKPSRIKKGWGKFCSSYCQYKWQSGKNNPNWGKRKKGKENPNWKGAKKICPICMKEFHIRPSGKRKYCSLKCYWLSTRGKNSPHWKGDKCISPIVNKIRTSGKYLKWRQDIYIRDNFTCQKCGQIGGKLNAHHIKSFSKLIKEVKINLPLLDLYEGAMLYTPLWNVPNGITLCEKCHKKTRKRRNNGKKISKML